MTEAADPPDPKQPWKGLDTSRMPVFIGYDQVERMIAALLDTAAEWQPDAVVGIVRGGLVPAAMAAGMLALPLFFVRHDNETGAIGWVGPAASGRRVLLVDDCCSSGQTLRRARAALIAEGRDCLTLVVVHDPETVVHRPDLSFPMRDLFRLPWERGEATPTGRAVKATGLRGDPGAEAPFVGIGLDAVPPAHFQRAVQRAVLISSLPEAERTRIAAALASTPYRHLPLECWGGSIAAEVNARPHAADAVALARYKAETATRWGCTHFIETDPEQAIRISAHAPHLIVTWTDPTTGKPWILGAAPPAPGIEA